MARPIRRIEIYLPLEYNDGRSIPEIKFVSLQAELMDRFGGVTSTQRQFPLEGVWRAESGVYQDRVFLFTVMDFRSKTEFEIIQYLERLKNRLKKKFEQLEILITVQQLLAI